MDITNRELDMLIIGFAAGALAFLWVGYWLRRRVERWELRQFRREVRQAAKSQPAEQDARAVLRKPRVIPLERRAPSPSAEVIPVIRDPSKVTPVPIPRAGVSAADLHWSHPDNPSNVTARAIREDAIAALVDSGFKRVAAVVAVDACSMVERAGGLESWVAAALRRASAK